jgi:hypothetical protein
VNVVGVFVQIAIKLSLAVVPNKAEASYDGLTGVAMFGGFSNSSN